LALDEQVNDSWVSRVIRWTSSRQPLSRRSSREHSPPVSTRLQFARPTFLSGGMSNSPSSGRSSEASKLRNQGAAFRRRFPLSVRARWVDKCEFRSGQVGRRESAENRAQGCSDLALRRPD